MSSSGGGADRDLLLRSPVSSSGGGADPDPELRPGRVEPSGDRGFPPVAPDIGGGEDERPPEAALPPRRSGASGSRGREVPPARRFVPRPTS